MEAVDGVLSPAEEEQLEQQLQQHPNPEYLEMYRYMKHPLPLSESFPEREPSPFAAQRLVSRLDAEEELYDTVQLVFKRFVLAPLIALLLFAVGLRWFSGNTSTGTVASTDTYSWIELENQEAYYQIPDYAVLQRVSEGASSTTEPSQSQ